MTLDEKEETRRNSQYKKGVISKILILFYGNGIPVILNQLDENDVSPIIKEYLFWNNLR